jgi:hypothetical protein
MQHAGPRAVPEHNRLEIGPVPYGCSPAPSHTSPGLRESTRGHPPSGAFCASQHDSVSAPPAGLITV